MSFRAEDEALRQRVAGLEAELAVAQSDLDAARRDVADVPGLRARALTLEQDLARLRATIGGLRQTWPTWAAVLLLSLCAALGVGVLLASRERDAATVHANELEVQVRSTEEALAEESHRADVSERRALEAERRIEEAERRTEAARGVASVERPVSTMPVTVSGSAVVVTTGSRSSTSIHATARVEAVSGSAPVGASDSCTVVVSVGTDDLCRAEVVCAGRPLYHGGGATGSFACELDGARQVVRGADVNPTSVSGDPRLDYDRTRGSVIVDDGPGPEWSVTIRLEPIAIGADVRLPVVRR